MAVTGRVVRVNGPLVEVEGLDRVAVLDVLEIGDRRLTAEVVAVRPGRATAQVYDYTGGLAVGTPVTGGGRPLSARLGPNLLGSTFDGLLRPLRPAGRWLQPGRRQDPQSVAWSFQPACSPGQDIAPGGLIGTVSTTAGLEHRVMAPAAVSGTVDWVSGPAEVLDDQPVARIGALPVTLAEWWPVRRQRPYVRALPLSVPLLTGQRVVDLLFPLALGATAAVPGGFGTGKTVLLQQIVKWCSADVIVFVGCGERGNELVDALTDLSELQDPRTGRPLAERTVVIANTSNMAVMAREASIYTGMTVAEYYRDMGYHAVLLADSTSRWAESLREFSSRNGELPVEEGYPASLPSALAAFYERAGRVITTSGREGSVTAVGSVSPPGGDMTEPVSAHTERFVRCLWSLDRDLAYARHYPAITWRRSFSRDAESLGAWHAADGRPGWAEDRRRAIALLTEADRVGPMAELVGVTALPDRERVVLLAARLLRDGVLQQSAVNPNDTTCGPVKQAALLRAVLEVHDLALALLQSGGHAETLELVDMSQLVRARNETGPDDGAGVESRCAVVLAAMERAVGR